MVYFYIVLVMRVLLDLVLRKFTVRGTENLPRKGGFILASKHVSFFDPPAIGYAIAKYRGRSIRYMAKAELGRNPLARFFFRFCNVVYVRRGQGEKAMLERVTELLCEDRVVLIFPEGTSRLERRRLHAGVGFLAIHSKKPILPVSIEVQGFERKSTVRGVLGMILSWIFGKGEISVTFGLPLLPSEDWRDSKMLAQLVLKRIESI